MNINPLNWFRSGEKRLQGMPMTAREAAAQGAYTTMFNDWLPRMIAPRLYEGLREAITTIDAAIDRLTTLDGILRVQGDNDKLTQEIEEWMRNVQVNDMDTGLQQFYRLTSNEGYEQGFAVGEFVLSKKRDEVEALRTADSKGVIFQRDKTSGKLRTWYKPPAPTAGRGDGTDQVERVLRNTYSNDITSLLNQYDYREITTENMVYYGLNCEGDNPYGTSIMRSMPFVARILLTIDNAVMQTWERFGNPAFAVTYKTKNRRVTPGELVERQKTLATNLASVLDIKRKGNSADFVNAVGADDDLTITVIGSDNQVLEVETPARHVLEQIVAKTGLPSWMLGFHWSTAERLAATQGVMIIQESKTRFESRLPGLNRIVETMLRARGRTWKKGDWELYQELPNLQDIVAQAQANFLNKQAEMMGSNAQGGEPKQSVGGQRFAHVTASGKIILPGDLDHEPAAKHAHAHAHKEAWVETDPELPRLEAATERKLLGAWRGLYPQVLKVLGIESGKGAKSPVFVFDAAIAYQALIDLADEFVAAVGAEDADLARNMYAAWVRGVVNAGEELDADKVTESLRQLVRDDMAAAGLELASDATTRALKDDIIEALTRGDYDGQNPTDVARTLKQRFDAHDIDWQRIARSEISAAQARGKMDQYGAHGIEQYDWKAAGNACPICTGYESGGPYSVGTGPMPMSDSHPNCRCTVTARIEE